MATMTRPLTYPRDIDAEKNADQQEEQATDHPGPVRYVHFKFSVE